MSLPNLLKSTQVISFYLIKWTVHPKIIMSFQTCTSFFLPWNIKIFLKNVGNQTVLVPIDVSRLFTLGIKGIVHFEIKFWYALVYHKGIQDVQ